MGDMEQKILDKILDKITDHQSSIDSLIYDLRCFYTDKLDELQAENDSLTQENWALKERLGE